MCGITGICGLHQPAHPEPQQILLMMNALHHRGPDEAGYYLDDWAAIGQERLSIIDLAGGSQPIPNEDRSLWIVYNGEIFNYPELRENLIQKGHRFHTHSDTEVLLHQIEQYGPAGLTRLNGQFAFAVWNSEKKELFLARDRVGINPLFFTTCRDQFLFASEIKSLFTHPDVPRKMDPIALDQIFTFWTTLPGRTAFQNISELPPGHYLHLKNGTINIRPYWSFPLVPPSEYTTRPIEELTEQIQTLLIDSVRIRLRADVPVGCYLSGGLDSSAITSAVVKNFNNQVRTFGIRFEESAFDEGDYQTQMVDCLKVSHTELYADNRTIGQNFDKVLWHTEKPILRTAPIPLFLLSQVVRDHNFKVVLTGEGADEIFGGYNLFRECKIRAFWARQPKSQKRAELLGHLYPYIFKNPRLKKPLQAFFAQGLDQIDDPFFSHQIRWKNTASIKNLFSQTLRQSIGGYNPIEELAGHLPPGFDAWDPLIRAQYLESALFLSNYLLSSQGDRMAMGHSVEIRVPYLDHRVIEFMATVPPRWKILGLKEKFLLKRVFRDTLPESVVNRSKHPYRAPIQQTLLHGSGSFHQEMENNPLLKSGQFFDPKKVKGLARKIEQTSTLSETDGMALAGIYSTLLIHRQFIEQFSPPLNQGPPLTVQIDNRSMKKV